MNKRSDILDEAKRIINSDRNRDYGEPEDNFGDIAAVWNWWLEMRGFDFRLSAVDAAMMHGLAKASRIPKSPQKEDHYVDLCGYFSIAGQLALPQSRED